MIAMNSDHMARAPFSYWLDVVLATTIGGLVINCIFPMDNAASRWLAEQAVPIILSSLAVGGFAFLLHRKQLMLVSFMSCIALCSFLKEAQNQQFSYARPTNDLQIRVAHFAPTDERMQIELLHQVESLRADLISVQIPTQTAFEQALRTRLNCSHLYQKRLEYADNMSILLFSNRPIQDLDTVYLGSQPSLAGSILVDSVHGKIQFLSTYVSHVMRNTPSKELQEQLARMGHYLEQRSPNMPLLTLGEIQLASWSPEVQAFKENAALNDSRIDLDWVPSDEHIFYSNHLQCIDFTTLLDGNGVMGTYQFRHNMPASKTSVSTSNVQGRLTMF